MKFMDQEFLLTTRTSSLLYHQYAQDLPIIDYHCHISPMEIANDRKFDNITQVWLGGDHYKWRQMRSNGVPEIYITGNSSDRKKFQMWAQTLPKAVGNPLYHWSHLELQRFFGYEGVLNQDTAEKVWNLCNEKLQQKEMSVRNIMRKSNVKVVCTTDDPVDDLKWHDLIRKDKSFDIQVLPSWRPDKTMAVDSPVFKQYMEQLSEVSGVEVWSFESWKEAIVKRMNFFEQMGCKVSDHGLKFVPYRLITDKKADVILQKALMGQKIAEEEVLQFTTACMLFLGREYAKRNWVMQLHFGVTRNNNKKMFKLLGPDTGFDGIYNCVPMEELSSYLNDLEEHGGLPKTILYSLNPNDNASIGALIGCFQNSDAVGKLQHGCAWWFNDHKVGMKDMMLSLANLGLLGNFVGMLTDSRSFLSYTRHEYFRRILCQILGDMVEGGEYPLETTALRDLVQGISFYNANRYFGFDLNN